MTSPQEGATSASLPVKALLANYWQHSQGHLHRNRLQREAGELADAHFLPATLGEWKGREAELRAHLHEQLHLGGDLPELEVQEHGEIRCEGYVIRKYSFLGTPQNRIPVNVYIPDGEGPFPAMLNVHGHHPDGKIAPRVQERGHLLALSGFVALCVDAAGAGERGEKEREWVYHGGELAAEMFLYGDSLLAQMVRDNMRCVDFLQSLPFVDSDRIGVTGASGGGNQTMWVAALDERLKVAVPVVSVGAFEAYVTRCNCVCETLPGFLREAEEWAILGLIAPRPLLVLNALHDQPAFGYEPMSATCRSAQEIYRLYGVRERCDFRILNAPHGYFPEGQEAMIGWVKHWLAGAPGSGPQPLPLYETQPREDLICFPRGERPETLDYRRFRRERLTIARAEATGGREELAWTVGWELAEKAQFSDRRSVSDGVEAAHFVSPRRIPVPVHFSERLSAGTQEIRLILSPSGKRSDYTREALKSPEAAKATAVVADLPGTGETGWDGGLGERRFHDASRATIWLGYTLAGEWAEAIASLLAGLRQEAPDARIVVQAEAEAGFAALIAQAIQPVAGVTICEEAVPASLLDEKPLSLVWFVPGFLEWGDLDTLRELARG